MRDIPLHFKVGTYRFSSNVSGGAASLPSSNSSVALPEYYDGPFEALLAHHINLQRSDDSVSNGLRSLGRPKHGSLWVAMAELRRMTNVVGAEVRDFSIPLASRNVFPTRALWSTSSRTHGLYQLYTRKIYDERHSRRALPNVERPAGSDHQASYHSSVGNLCLQFNWPWRSRSFKNNSHEAGHASTPLYQEDGSGDPSPISPVS